MNIFVGVVLISFVSTLSVFLFPGNNDIQLFSVLIAGVAFMVGYYIGGHSTELKSKNGKNDAAN